MTDGAAPPAGADRLDKWLWHARFFKTRTLATKLCRSGKVRVNAERVTKANALVTVGDVLTFPQGNRIRVARIRAMATRRGPAAEAQQLYDDLTPPEPPRGEEKAGARPRGGGRPTKRERRALDRLMGKEDPD